MNGSLVPMRFVVMLLLIVALVMFYPLRLLQWDKYAYGCYNGKSLRVGQEVIQLGRLSIHGFQFTCDDKNKYDPRTTKPLQNANPASIPDFTN